MSDRKDSLPDLLRSSFDQMRRAHIKITKKRVAYAIGIALILAIIIFVIASVVYEFEWIFSLRFQLGLVPFEKPAFVDIATPFIDGEEIRPIESDHDILKIMDFIASIAKSEKKYPEVNANRTLPRFEMAWSLPARINIFGTEYKVWRLELWVTKWIKNENSIGGFRPEALYLNIRFQETDNVSEKIFQIEDPELTMDAFRLLIDAYKGAGGLK